MSDDPMDAAIGQFIHDSDVARNNFIDDMRAEITRLRAVITRLQLEKRELKRALDAANPT